VEGWKKNMLPRQLHLSRESLELRAEVVPVRNGGILGHKPVIATGLWTSTYDEEEQSSEWIEWCRSNYQSPLDARAWFLLEVEETARIATIDTLADFRTLLDQYARPALYEMSFSSLDERKLDFERLAHDFDALHLTRNGQDETQFDFPHLWGWDCESTVWFRWCFSSVERIRLVEPVARRKRVSRKKSNV
jgi:hypothetical protein